MARYCTGLGMRRRRRLRTCVICRARFLPVPNNAITCCAECSRARKAQMVKLYAERHWPRLQAYARAWRAARKDKGTCCTQS
jgi:hypothetical protein